MTSTFKTASTLSRTSRDCATCTGSTCTTTFGISTDAKTLNQSSPALRWLSLRYLDRFACRFCLTHAFEQVLEFCKVYDEDVTYGNKLHGKTVTIINRSE